MAENLTPSTPLGQREITSPALTARYYCLDDPLAAGDDGFITHATLLGLFSSSSAGFEYNFSTNTAATNPGGGGVKYNNGTASAVTEVYMSSLTIAGLDVGDLIETSAPGSNFIVAQLDDNTRTQIYEIAAEPIRNSDTVDWFTISVNFVSTGTGGTPQNNRTVSVQGIVGGPTLLTNALRDTVVPLTSSGNIVAWDSTDGNTYTILNQAENTVLQNPSNPPPTGTTMNARFIHSIASAGGPYTFSFDTAFDVISGTVDTTLNAQNIIDAQYVPSLSQWWVRITNDLSSGGGGGPISDFTDVNLTGLTTLGAITLSATTSKCKAIHTGKRLAISAGIVSTGAVASQSLNIRLLVDHVLVTLGLTLDPNALGMVGTTPGATITRGTNTIGQATAIFTAGTLSNTYTGVITARSLNGVVETFWGIRSTFDSTVTGERRWGTNSNLPAAWGAEDILGIDIEVPVVEDSGV